MTFGLESIFTIFQGLMQITLNCLTTGKGLLYLEDIILHRTTEQEHFHNLAAVLDRLEELGPRLKPKKCHFMQSQLKYLGHITSVAGIPTDSKIIEHVAHSKDSRGDQKLSLIGFILPTIHPLLLPSDILYACPAEKKMVQMEDSVRILSER